MTVYAPSPAAAAGVTGVITTPGGTPQTGTVDVTVPQTTKDEVAYATAAALPANTYNNGVAGIGATLTANANGALSVDGQAVQAGQRILVKNEATAANNGIYTVTATGSGVLPYILTRATDYNTPAGIGPGDVVAVAGPAGSLGATNDGKLFVSSAPAAVTVGTSAITFAVPPVAAAAFHGARAVASAQSAALVDNTETSVLLDTNTYDTDAFHSITVNTSRFTVPAGMGGRYLILGKATFLLATHASLLQLILKKNGATYLGITTFYATTVSQRYSLLLQDILPLVVGDYIELRVQSTNGFAEVKLEGDTWSPGATTFAAEFLAA